MHRRSGGTADEKRKRHSASGHHTAQFLHTVERWGYQTAHSYDVSAQTHSLVKDDGRRDHHPQVGDFEAPATEDSGGNVLAYVVYVSLHGCNDEAGSCRAIALSVEERSQQSHGGTHCPC